MSLGNILFVLSFDLEMLTTDFVQRIENFLSLKSRQWVDIRTLPHGKVNNVICSFFQARKIMYYTVQVTLFMKFSFCITWNHLAESFNLLTENFSQKIKIKKNKLCDKILKTATKKNKKKSFSVSKFLF